MTRTIVGRLIAKDLYLHRWLIVCTLAIGLFSIVLSGRGGGAGNIGWILFVTDIVAFGIFLVFYSLLAERQTRAVLFTLSLPVSPMQYTLAKVGAILIAFLIPWVILTATILGFTLAFDPPGNGLIPFTLVTMGLFLANLCILVAVALTTGSEIWGIAGIIATNTSVPIVLGTIVPNISGDIRGPVAVWSPGMVMTLGIEAAVIVLSLLFAFVVQSRRKDFV